MSSSRTAISKLWDISAAMLLTTMGELVGGPTDRVILAPPGLDVQLRWWVGGVGGVTRIGLAGRLDELCGWGRLFMEEARRIDALPPVVEF